jgi:hypothetical protein
MIRIRHPFSVRAIEPRLAFAGSPHQMDTGDKTVRLEADAGVGLLTMIVSHREAPEFRLGAIMTVEVIGPDPFGKLYDLEVGPPGTLVESEAVRAAAFEAGRKARAALEEVKQQANRLREALREKEWAGSGRFGPYCIFCGRARDEDYGYSGPGGHAEHCEWVRLVGVDPKADSEPS